MVASIRSLPDYYALESRLTAHHSERMLDLARISSGMSVLDIASGQGEPSLRAARRVGSTGRVLGIDRAEASLQAARAEAARENLQQVQYRAHDAEEVDGLGETFDAVTCRWALMYFGAPRKSLAAIARCMKPDALLVAALWGRSEEIDWWRVPREITARFVALPPIDPDAPSAAHYGDLARFEADLQQAGLEAIHTEAHTITVVEGDDVRILVGWAETIFGRLLVGLSNEARAAWASALVEALQAHRAHGRYALGGVSRLVVARRTAGRAK